MDDKTNRYKLPEGEGELGHRFRQLCEVFDIDQIRKAEEHVRDALLRLARIQHPLYHENLRRAVFLAESSMKLIRRYDSMSPEEKLLAVGAVRYFLIGCDSHHDMCPTTGLNDDCLVMNFVLEQMGMLDDSEIPDVKGWGGRPV
jgi:uncharacterized membrane protein YkvA (DUF1232 family)